MPTPSPAITGISPELNAKRLELRAQSKRAMRPTLGWSALSPRVEARVMPGDHHSSITVHVGETAALLRACLEGTPDAPFRAA